MSSPARAASAGGGWGPSARSGAAAAAASGKGVLARPVGRDVGPASAGAGRPPSQRARAAAASTAASSSKGARGKARGPIVKDCMAADCRACTVPRAAQGGRSMPAGGPPPPGRDAPALRAKPWTSAGAAACRRRPAAGRPPRAGDCTPALSRCAATPVGLAGVMPSTRSIGWRTVLVRPRAQTSTSPTPDASRDRVNAENAPVRQGLARLAAATAGDGQAWGVPSASAGCQPGRGCGTYRPACPQAPAKLAAASGSSWGGVGP
jgi:hypothetical protein